MFNLFNRDRVPPRQKLNRWQGMAIVETTIRPNRTGRVHFKGSDWNARCLQAVTLKKGKVVDVLRIEDNLILVVTPSAYEPMTETQNRKPLGENNSSD